MQHYQLGRLIKHRYTVENQLIYPNYTRDEIYVRSTDSDRTLMSVLSQLSALFPPDEEEVKVMLCVCMNVYVYIL